MRDWLRDARLKQKLTQKQVANAIGVSEAYYSMIESGNRQKDMNVCVAIKLGNVLGLSLQEIVDAEGGGE